ncbi:MAG: arginine--tRNA ligase [Patescibacteria group bacterium]|nr:arginine--tRNA ligase [Patescibacteria group bacterium]
MIAQKIKEALQQFVQEKFSLEFDATVEHPANEDFGEFATNLALSLYSENEKIRNDYQSPRDLAAELTSELSIWLPKSNLAKVIKDVSVAGPGFINFRLNSKYFTNNVREILQNEQYGLSDVGKEKTWEIEHTSPNPNKAMHLGHLRNNVTGMAISNLWEAVGINVIREAVDNDRGIAIARLMWGYLKYARKSEQTPINLDHWYSNQNEWLTAEETDKRPDLFVDELYINASKDFKEDKQVQQQVRQMVVDWEAEDEKTRALWSLVMQYSHQGQNMTLERLGNKWDRVWHEHDHYQQGKDLVKFGLEKGIFRQLEDGAILTNLAEYDLPDTILRKSDGTSLYITQDLALTKLKVEKTGAEKLHWLVGPEQSLALKQMFACCEQLGFIDYENLVHIDYGYMSIKGQGKMSSRAGNVIYIDDMIDLAKEKVLAIMNQEGLSQVEVKALAEKVAVGAVKYSILKVARKTDTAFDLETALRLDGNSGPYLQYAHARACSVLIKARKSALSQLSEVEFNLDVLEFEESYLLKYLYRFPEVVEQAAFELEPSQVATYVFELAQRFNRFYNKHQILQVENELSLRRLALTQATSKVIRQGLNLLGISAPERM